MESKEEKGKKGSLERLRGEGERARGAIGGEGRNLAFGREM